MCGICGATDAGRGSVLEIMNAAMVHRGPDDDGIHVDPEAGVGIGARRLSIIDLEGGHQPLSNEDGTVWAVLNGEIYNFHTLQRRLLGSGHTLSSLTDTEVLVHLYEEFGTDLVHALDGMFAFAIWDSRQRRLILARDRFGEKPLFYVHRAGHLRFASELTALLAGSNGAPELDAAAVDAYFSFGYVLGPRSIVRGIRQLQPGHLLVWEQGAGLLDAERYWSPPGPVAGPNVHVSELVAETRELLDASLERRLVADVPVGVFLSGGVDSTLVATLAAAQSSRPIKTFTVGYGAAAVDETAAARRSAALVRSDHHELLLTAADVAELAPRALRALDQPLADPAFVALRAVTEFARQHVKVVVGGEGADELFGGYPRYAWLSRSDRLATWLPRSFASRSATLLGRISPSRRASRLYEVVKPQSAVQRHVAWVTERRVLLRDRLYGPRLRPHLDTHPLRDERTSTGIGSIGDLRGDVAGEFMRLDQLHWLPDDVLAKADRASMQVSLELRTPFLNRELAEFAAGVATSVHLHASGKFLLRKVLEEVAPEAAYRRQKVAFRTPTGRWLRGPLAAVLSEQLQGSTLYADGWFDRRAVAQLANEHQDGRRDWSFLLWPVFALAAWMDGFTDATA